MAWNSLTNMRALQTTLQLVVEICRQMENWRRLLRYVDRIEAEREQEAPSQPSMAVVRRIDRRDAA